MVAFVIMFSGGFAKGFLRLLIAAIVFRAEKIGGCWHQGRWGGKVG